MGQLEPNDSRNVTGTASTPDGHWTNAAGQMPTAAGEPSGIGAEDASGASGADFTGGEIREHMTVIDSAGATVGIVDSVDGDRIKLTREHSADGHHHYIAIGDVESVEGNTVYLIGSGPTDFAANAG